MIKTVNADKLSQNLGELYRRYGYSRYKMSKFEEYDTYVSNKDFLVSDRVITFTDVSGKLLAMKPDVTISMIKNTDDKENTCHKLYYNENVYRVSKDTHAFKEIMQIGLECMGEIDLYNILEVISLAGMSLASISDSFILDVSHMGLVYSILTECGFSQVEIKSVLAMIGEKNLPRIYSLCAEKNLDNKSVDKLTGLVNIYGEAKEVIAKLTPLCEGAAAKKALQELKNVASVFEAMNSIDKLRIDFSVVNDMNYYNGLVFQGYIEGIPTHILSGGQYDKLMEKMGKSTHALGFAIYLDLLEYLDNDKNEYDTDVVLLYSADDDPSKVYKKVYELTSQGLRTLALTKIPETLRFKIKTELENGGAL